MTLILTCLTKDYLIQISDKRLTYPDRRVASNNTNKAVLQAPFVSWGYTGLATIQGEAADIWWARQLKEVEKAAKDNLDYRRLLTVALNQKFNSLRPSVKRLARHAYVGMYWARQSGRLLPGLVEFSNFLRLPFVEEGPIKFMAFGATIPDRHTHYLHTAGAAVSDQIKKTMDLYIRKCIKAQTGPKEIAVVMASGLLKIAAHDPTVGKDFLTICFPRTVAERVASGDPNLFLNDMPGKDFLSFWYSNYDGSTSIQYWPTVLMDGMISAGTISSNSFDDLPKAIRDDIEKKIAEEKTDTSVANGLSI